MYRNRRAFSLVELVIVLAICALTAGIAMPRLGRAANRYRADFAARRIVADLDRARGNARLTGQTQTATFNVAQNNYTVTGSASGQANAFSVNLTDNPLNATLVSVNLGGGAAAVSFDAYGQARPAVDGTIVIRCGTDSRTVTLGGGSSKATWK